MKLSASDIGEMIDSCVDWCVPICGTCGANDGDKDDVICPVTRTLKVLIMAKKKKKAKAKPKPKKKSRSVPYK